MEFMLELRKVWVRNGVSVLLTDPRTLMDGVPWNVVVQVQEGLKGVGYGLLIFFFLYSLFKYSSSFKEITPPSIAGYILRFLAAKLTIDYAADLCGAFLNLGMRIGTIVTTSSDASAMMNNITISDSVKQMVEQMTFFESLGVMIIATLAFVVTFACCIFFLITVYGRFFRVYIHVALSPVMTAGFGGEATSSMGRQYVRSLLAVCLEMAVMLLAVGISTSMINGIEAGSGLNIWNSSVPFGAVMDYITTALFSTGLMVASTAGARRLISSMMGGGA